MIDIKVTKSDHQYLLEVDAEDIMWPLRVSLLMLYGSRIVMTSIITFGVYQCCCVIFGG